MGVIEGSTSAGPVVRQCQGGVFECTGQVCVVAPVFSDFAGKSWESEYTRLLGSYYAALEAVGGARVRGVGEPVDRGSSVEGDVSRGGDVGGREESSFDASVRCVDCASVSSGVGSAGKRPLFVDVDRGAGGSKFVGGVEVDAVGSVSEKLQGVSGGGFEFAGVLYSTKTERNRARREAAKLRKAGRKVLGIGRGTGGIPAWRVNATDNVSSVKHGYFSECPLDVQKELRDTRAQLLIARNKKDLEAVQKQIARASSQEAVVRDCLRLMKVTEQVKKRAAESRVGGWAETIADSAVVSFASSVPSTVPSLESVGVGRSALSSVETGESSLDVTQQLRKAEYDARKSVIVSEFEEYGGDMQRYERVLGLLADEYDDVLLSSHELEKKDMGRRFELAMSAIGVGPSGVVQAMRHMGFDCDSEGYF